VTLLPADDFGIKGHPGPAYDVGELCWVPGCDQRAVHAHHMWPRSFLRGQPYEWVMLPDGTIIGNRMGACFLHHDACSSPLGGHKARVVFEGGVFWWEEADRIATPEHSLALAWTWRRVGPLDPQPPGASTTVGAAAWSSNRKDVVVEDVLVDLEICPHCGHVEDKKPKKKIPAGPPRKVKEWTIKVPDDAEIGSDVLDEWADDLAVILGFSDESSRLRRYHAVATGLAWVIQHRHEFVADVVEAANASH
jgi:hypothetical protein